MLVLSASVMAEDETDTFLDPATAGADYRKLDLDEQELEREKNSKIRKAGLEMKREIRRIETRVKVYAYFLPAILPICFGLLFLGLRRQAEQQSIAPSRRRR